MKIQSHLSATPFLRSFLVTTSLLVSASFSLGQAASNPDYLNPNLPAEKRAADLVSRMTIEERAHQMEDWAPAIQRLGVPDYQWWNEGLHGVARSGYATVFPQAIGLAATWDTALIHSVGDVISTEARAKYNQAQREGNHSIYFGLDFWSPNINIFRDPRWGRGQETYGEDPYLTSRIGLAFVTGMQGDDPKYLKVVATPKHFAVHSGPEPLRHGFNVDVSPRDLEETYLPAFRTTVTEGNATSVMCSYNAVDKYPSCANTMLLQEHLRKDWGFKGYVVSDCNAIVDITEGHKLAPDLLQAAVVAVKAGTDIACSMGNISFGQLADAAKKGLISEDAINQSVTRLFTARIRLGMFDPPSMVPYNSIPFSANNSPEHRAIALKTAEESIVLLKNANSTLPLSKKIKRIAIIGVPADLVDSLEGNYNGTPQNPVTPLDSIRKQLGARAQVTYAQGSSLADNFLVPVSRTAFGAGLKVEYFNNATLSDPPVETRTEPSLMTDWIQALPTPAITQHDYSVRWTGTIAPPAAGDYTFSINAPHPFPSKVRETYTLFLDDKLVAESTDPDKWAPAVVRFPDATAHKFRFEYTHAGSGGGGVTLTWKAPADAQRAEAVAIASKADIALVFVGLSFRLEGEEMPVHIDGFDGGDRTSLDLPKPQEDLLEAVAATGKPVVLVMMSGSALSVNWAQQHVPAIVEAWYPGEEGGAAIARTLTGENNPAGRLPVTFYASTNDLPPFADYSMANRTYRYSKAKPLYGFGYGLSYSSFKYGELALSTKSLAAGSPLKATVSVTNTSAVPGDEVVELYLKPPTGFDGPIQSLIAFRRVHIDAGKSQEVSFDLDPRALSLVDAKGDRAVMPGTYRLSAGGAQPQETTAHADAELTITGTQKLPR